jgi:hypothetical protein
VIEDEGVLRLRARGHWTPRVSNSLPEALEILQLGERVYLLRPGEKEEFLRDLDDAGRTLKTTLETIEEVQAFVEFRDSGREPRHKAHGRFLLRRDDWEKPAGAEAAAAFRR